MNLLINASVTVNIVLILLFVSVCVINFKENTNPKLRAKFGTILGAVLLLYLILLITLSVIGLVQNNSVMQCLFVFAVIPFCIGHFVTYKTLKIFSVIQLIAFVLNLYFLIML